MISSEPNDVPAQALRAMANRVIVPLVRRHAEDAAFYWSQHDASDSVPGRELSTLARFSNLLAAHLEGLEVASHHGSEVALAALVRWKLPGEAFVAAYAVLTAADEAHLDSLLKQVKARPETLLRGLISALAWLPRAIALPFIARWSSSDSDAVTQVAALRALALIEVADAGGEQQGAVLSQTLGAFLGSATAEVRAAACRVAALSGDDPVQDAGLRACLEDPDLAVRAEAAIAIGQRCHMSPMEQCSAAQLAAAEALWQDVVRQSEIVASSSGGDRKQALRRLARWVRELAGLIPPGHPQIAALLNVMPVRAALRFVAYHGDPQHLPFVLAHMADDASARLAGWVWETVTGVDLREAGLSLPDAATADHAAQGEARPDAEHGLALPDAAAVRAHALHPLPPGERHLLGEPLNMEIVLACLADAPGSLRDIAAHFMRHQYRLRGILVRGRAGAQAAAVDRLERAWCESGPDA